MPMLMWTGTDEWRAEAAQVERHEGRFDATGVQLGTGPVPYRLDYVLETTAGWVTSSLQVTAQGDGWRRTLALTRSPQGRWSGAASDSALDGVLDCDLGFSPLTNSMPILRHRLHERAGCRRLHDGVGIGARSDRAPVAPAVRAPAHVASWGGRPVQQWRFLRRPGDRRRRVRRRLPAAGRGGLIRFCNRLRYQSLPFRGLTVPSFPPLTASVRVRDGGGSPT